MAIERIEGKQLKRLMRKNKDAMRELKARTGITLKRIRHVFEAGLEGAAVRDWCQANIGEDPGASFTIEDLENRNRE